MSLTIRNNYNYSTNTNSIKSTSPTSQVTSSEDSTKSSSSSLNTHEVKFIMENGMAEGAYVDGIKMSLTDMFLTSKSQLKENINKEYDKTDVEKLEEIFGL